MTPLISPVARLRRHERGHLIREEGVALVEFAFVLPLLLLLVLGIIDFGKAFNFKNDETHLANQAARYASVNSCSACTAAGQTISAYIANQAGASQLRKGLQDGIPPAVTPATSIKIAFADSTGKFPDETGYNSGSLPAKNHCIGSPVKALLIFSYPFMPYLKLGSFTIKGAATMRLEKDWGDASGHYRAGTDLYEVTPTTSASADSC